MLTAERRILGRIMHSQTALRCQWDKGRKNNSQFASPSIRRPTFSDTPKGAAASATVYTMVEMARAHGLNIYKYL